MPVDIIGEVVVGLIEVAANSPTSSDSDDNKRSFGCLALIFVIAVITVISYCIIKF